MLGRQLATAWGRALRRRNLAQPPPCSVSMLDACSHPPTHPSQFPLPKFPPGVGRNSHAETAGQHSRAAEDGIAASLPLLLPSALLPNSVQPAVSGGGGRKDSEPSLLSAGNNVVVILKRC